MFLVRSAGKKTELIYKTGLLNRENAYNCVTFAQPQSHRLEGDCKCMETCPNIMSKCVSQTDSSCMTSRTTARGYFVSLHQVEL